MIKFMVPPPSSSLARPAIHSLRRIVSVGTLEKSSRLRRSASLTIRLSNVDIEPTPSVLFNRSNFSSDAFSYHV